MDDPFVSEYQISELQIAGEFLTNWLPFLTKDLCSDCSTTLRDRVRSLDPGAREFSGEGQEDPHDPTPDRSSGSTMSCGHSESNGLNRERTPESSKVRMSWADMAQEDELEEEEEEARRQGLEVEEEEEEEEEEVKRKPELSREQRELIRFGNVGRKKDFICLERVKGKIVNILDGLELHTGVFSAAEQKRIVDFVYELQEKGRQLQLGEHTYSEPRKWMRGKGRVTIQFGCCYNYAMDKQGNPPGIRQSVVADPMPPLFKVIIRRLVRWHVMPTSCVPDSCIVNMYEPGDCIPPHIDSHDFVRPFCTVSFLSECNILFGSNLKIVGQGEFTGSIAVPLPVGSVLILNGNGADVAKHCVPAVPTKRISITFRKMDESKKPAGFIPEPDLQNVQPLPYDSGEPIKRSPPRNTDKQPVIGKNLKKGEEIVGRPVGFEPNPGLHVNQRLLHDSDTPTGRSAHRIMDGRHPMNSRNSDRGKESARKPFGFRARPDFQGSQHLQDDTWLDSDTWFEPNPGLHINQPPLHDSDTPTGRSTHRNMDGRHPMNRHNSDRGKESARKPLGFRARPDFQGSQHLQDDADKFSKGSEHQNMQGGSSNWEGGQEHVERRVHMEQNRFVITSNLEDEESSLAVSHRTSEPNPAAQIRVQTLNNGRRRVRVGLSNA